MELPVPLTKTKTMTKTKTNTKTMTKTKLLRDPACAIFLSPSGDLEVKVVTASVTFNMLEPPAFQKYSTCLVF